VLRRRQLQNAGVTPEDAAAIAATERLAAERNKFASTFRQLFGDIDTKLFESAVQSGREIVHGLITGMESLEDALKHFVLSFIETAIFGMIGSLLGGLISGNFAAAVPGPSAVNTVPRSSMQLQPGGFRASIDMSRVAPLTAFAVARDPEFQRVLREGIVV